MLLGAPRADVQASGFMCHVVAGHIESPKMQQQLLKLWWYIWSCPQGVPAIRVLTGQSLLMEVITRNGHMRPAEDGANR